jgi:hypothetical protein
VMRWLAANKLEIGGVGEGAIQTAA